ncbi:MAG: Eco57I restriction-modification methylase domain-containing protein, partial [Limisphaerales bacterium]
MDAVLCVEGRPTVCVKDARTLSDADVDCIRQKLWNLGATTLLLVEGRLEVQLFSTFVKPCRPGDPKTLASRLADETIADMETAELALRLRQLVRRVETGAIYRENEPLFNSEHVIDRVLLANLAAARDLICPEKSAVGYRRAHALIGRFLFSCYLLDRGIIGDAYLTKNGLPAATDMLGMLNTRLINKAKTLATLFAALQRDFNGSLFGDQSIDVTEAEVNILQRFLSGDDMERGQMSLFKLYDFSFVPVELISSIYQEFLGAEAEAEEEPTGRNQLRNHGQRRLGAYYTPPRLAELTVDIATEGWDTLLDKRCFDGACGSGIFLVILFVRMAEEWRSRNPRSDTRRRYNELMRLLEENISGVDVNLTACLVTCFSLYLAFLDQMEPREIMELREALERDTRSKLLPRILWELEESRPRPPRLHTIRELDFFQLPTNAEFDLVIGNPPWISRKEEESRPAAQWVFSPQQNPAAVGVNKSEASQILFPAKEVACGFMWKAALHLKPSGRACQILPSRVFLSNNTDQFQAHWLKRHRLEAVWLLADYRFILFLGADCPCFIARYHSRDASEPYGEFDFITPKVELIDPREAVIPVQPEDQKILAEQDIVAAAEKTECALAWKKQHWGTPRDIRLIERLMRLPKLSRLTSRPPRKEKESDRAPFHWYKGQGFQPATDSTLTKREEPAPVFWNEA